ncbi:MAG: VWA domain-containing protein, partial [Polyangiaceae bacterium]|nr:VWA domain-containing protein [Polyangiaceae bacterium]
MAGPSTKWIGKRSPRGAAWARRGAALAAAAIAVATSLAACSGGDEGLDPPSPGGGGSGASGGGTTTGGPCAEGAQRECHVTIGEHDGVLTCLDGVETCEGGSWTGCNGSTRTMRAPGRLAGPEGGGQYPRPMSLSTATDCIDNPCDPSCQVFNEDPGPGGVTIPAALPPYPWNVGNINDVPPSVIDQGTQEPCSTAEDCQFDQYCGNPSGVACSHHPCAPGAGLFASCSPCVQKICDEDPTCCLVDYAGTCLHDPCAQGSALKASCDPCVASICAARPGCCEPLCTTTAECQALVGPTSTCNAQGRCSCGAAIGVCPTGASCTSGRCVPFWGSGSCVSQVPALCAPKTCPAANVWSAACAAKVATTCGAVCDPPDPAGCPHDKCYTGSALPMLTCGADPCVNLICTGAGGDSTCCTSAWTQSCVDKVLSMCAISCPTKGQCTSWLPDETDPGCAGVDLTLAIPCGGTVPVCTRGSATIPAGTTIDVVQYPAGANQIASSEPDEVLNSCNPAAGTPACSFTLPQALDGGDCVDVTGCVGLTDGMELMVN